MTFKACLNCSLNRLLAETCQVPTLDENWRKTKPTKTAPSQLIGRSTYLNEMMLGWFSLRRCLMSVSRLSLSFFIATSSPFSLPRNTAPWAPLPSHCRSDMLSNGISQSSTERHRERYIAEQTDTMAYTEKQDRIYKLYFELLCT